jgi:sterol desaturase/sphingolipid hydroxylase (fatty acid hydroxylase superfamily)
MADDDAAAIDHRYFKDSTSREAFREKMLRAVPRWYSPWGHLAGTTGVGVVALLLAFTQIHALRPLELLVVPIVFLISNLTEWHAHKNLLHRRWRPMAVLYDRHTPEHHRVYRYDDMQIRSWRELRLVLIPAMGVLGIALTSAPLALLTGWLVSANAGWLFLLTSSLYVVSYELSHLAYHMPEDSFVGRRAFVRAMREHHARHHDPRLMQNYNFNVTVPLGDWLFRTLAPDEMVQRIQSRAAGAGAASELARTPPMA